MDKFVVRKKREITKENPKERSDKVLRQSTIESLKGVVVVEDIRRAKALLRQATTSTKEMVACLVKLEKKIPSRKVLLETKIGNLINRLRKQHENEEVRKHARKVYVKWKSHFEDHRDRPQIEVQCDLKTEKTRKAGRNFISDALQLGEHDGNRLPEIIEREVFHSNRRLLTKQYKRTMRNIWFKLKNDSNLCEKVLSSEISVKEVIELCESKS